MDCKREVVAERFFKEKALLEEEKEEYARLLHYNHKKAALLASKIEERINKLDRAQKALEQADLNYRETPPPPLTWQEELMQHLLPLDHCLQKGATALQSKKRHFLLFRRHPKVVLAQALHFAAKEAEIVAKKMALLKKEPFVELCEDIELFCQKLIEQTEKRWNHSLYDGEFITLKEEWNTLTAPLRSDS